MAGIDLSVANPREQMKHLARLKRMLGPDAWRATPATMAAKLSGGRWRPYRHLLYISTLIAQAIARGERRLIVTLPPRHGKSELLSVWTPVWMFDRNPEASIILTSYGAELATDFSRKARDILQNPIVPLRAVVPKDVGQVGRFHTTAGGAMYAIGLGGSILGRGADLLLVDDFIKNAKEAMSPAVRQAHYEWFVSTALTRVEPGGTVIILAQRWDVDDLAGRLLLEDEENEWTEVRLPALAEENDPLGRAPGEALWPERRDEEALRRIQAQMGPYFWAALFQQNPMPRGSGLVDLSLLTPVDILPRHGQVKAVRSWDLAGTPGDGDYSVGGRLDFDPTRGLNYINDVVRGQWGAEKLEAMMKIKAVEDGPSVPIVLEQEPGSSGKNYAQYLKTQVLRGYSVRVRPATGSKFLRAQPAFAAISRGEVRMQKGPWNKILFSEIETFPEGSNDDTVDMLSLAWNEMHSPNAGSLVWRGSNLPSTPMYLDPRNIVGV